MLVYYHAGHMIVRSTTMIFHKHMKAGSGADTRAKAQLILTREFFEFLCTSLSSDTYSDSADKAVDTSLVED